MEKIYASLSWRLTKPLRKVRNFLSFLCNFPNQIIRQLRAFIKRFVLMALNSVGPKIYANPKLKKWCLAWLDNFPKLKSKVRALAMKNGWFFQNGSKAVTHISRSNTDQSFERDAGHLPPRVLRIYQALIEAREIRRR